jgi:hypothetical protein
VGLSEQRVRPTFGGHEKFVFRHGWLKKGVDGVKADPLIFTNDEALITLGVGKNMVRSIRHWCLATRLVEGTNGVGLSRPLAPTDFALKLLDPNGWDPYLEDIGSLWLLHWKLSTNLSRGFVFYLLFSRFMETEFTKRHLSNFLHSQFEQREIHATPGTIDREIDVCLHTYVPAIRTKSGSITEESLDCPLAELDLLRYIPNDNVYRLNIGPKNSLPLGVFGFTLLTFFSSFLENRRTVNVDDCIYREGSPGQVFKLDENSVVEYLEELEGLTEGLLRLEETAGLRQVYLEEDIAQNYEGKAYHLLRGYYEQK